MFIQDQNSTVNIWEQLVVQYQNNRQESGAERTLIVMGTAQSGKSTLIKLLKTDQEQQIKPTVLFDYSYIKKPSNKRQIIHCYQLSNQSQQDILPSLITSNIGSSSSSSRLNPLTKVKVVVCIDLSKPAHLIQNLEKWMEIIKKQFNTACQEKLALNERSNDYLNEVNNFMEIHEDKGQLTPLPLEVIIIGCKYDELEKQDSENRKWVCKAMRYYSHLYHAHLFFCSSISASIVSNVRSVFNEVLFGNKRTTYQQKDHLKPLFISKGQDSIQSINIGPGLALTRQLQIVKKQLASLFGTVQEGGKKQGLNIDLSRYPQPKIDKMIDNHKKEILKITKGGGLGLVGP